MDSTMTQPKCPTCNSQLSTGASQNGKARFFCVSQECPDRFKAISNPTPIKSTEK